MGFPGGSEVKGSACNVGDLGLIPGLGRSPGEWNGYPLQYSDLENSMDCSPWGHKELGTTEQLSHSWHRDPPMGQSREGHITSDLTRSLPLYHPVLLILPTQAL